MSHKTEGADRGWYIQHVDECWRLWAANPNKLKLVLCPRTHVTRRTDELFPPTVSKRDYYVGPRSS